MPKIRFTKSTLEGIPNTAEGQALYRDDLLPGFGLRVGTRSKTYFVETAVNGRNVRATVGRADVLLPDCARKRARAMLCEMADGIDPVRARRQSGAADVTLAKALDAFFKAKPHLSDAAVDAYTRTCNLYLRDWATTRLRDITRQMVLARHRLVAERHGQVTANNVMRHLRSVYNFTAATVDDLPLNPVAIITQARAWYLHEYVRDNTIETLDSRRAADDQSR